MAVNGELKHEVEIKAAADTVWELYGTPKLFNLIKEQSLVQEVQLIEGDGDTGTIVYAKFGPGLGFTEFKEKFTKIDPKNRVKETELTEGGYLSLGFSLFKVRIEIVEKDAESCIVKSCISYQAQDEATAAKHASTALLETMAVVVQKHLNC